MGFVVAVQLKSGIHSTMEAPRISGTGNLDACPFLFIFSWEERMPLNGGYYTTGHTVVTAASPEESTRREYLTSLTNGLCFKTKTAKLEDESANSFQEHLEN